MKLITPHIFVGKLPPQPMTTSEAGSLGGKKRWKGVSKKKRSEEMKKVSLARFS